MGAFRDAQGDRDTKINTIQHGLYWGHNAQSLKDQSGWNLGVIVQYLFVDKFTQVTFAFQLFQIPGCFKSPLTSGCHYLYTLTYAFLSNIPPTPSAALQHGISKPAYVATL